MTDSMHMSPLLTIAIPTFNRGKILVQNVKRLLENTAECFEILIGDNHSEDDTIELLNSIEDSRLKYFINKTNIGAVKNINKVLAASNGKYTYLISDEDYIPEGGLNSILKLIRGGCSYSLILGTILNAENGIFYSNVARTYKKGSDAISNLLFTHPYVSGIIYQREVITKFINSKFSEFIYPHEILIGYALAEGDTIFLDDKICIRGEVQACNIEMVNKRHFTHPFNRIRQFLVKKQYVDDEIENFETQQIVLKRLEYQMGIGLSVALVESSIWVCLRAVKRISRIQDKQINKSNIYYSSICYLFKMAKRKLKVVLFKLSKTRVLKKHANLYDLKYFP